MKLLFPCKSGFPVFKCILIKNEPGYPVLKWILNKNENVKTGL